MVVKTLWNPKGSDAVYCVEDGVHISPATRTAWRQDPNVHVIEISDDPHEPMRASIQHAAGQRPTELPDLRVSWVD